MKYFEIFIFSILFVINMILIIRIIKSKRIITKNDYRIVDLNLKKGREKNNFSYICSYYCMLIILVLMQLLVIGSLIIDEIQFIMFIGSFYAIIIGFNNQYFYISKNKIGTLYKLINGENIDFIEIKSNKYYCEIRIYYKDKKEKKINLRSRNTKRLIQSLRDYNYEVYCTPS